MPNEIIDKMLVLAKQSKITLFSLTDEGNKLAKYLKSAVSDAEHLHKPVNFIKTAQQQFLNGERCIFICATGIVVRALAPVLKDKYTDPAVLVLDEKGQFVIPLISGHEGGANALASQIASYLKAQLVITSSAEYTKAVYSIGMGCDKGCPKEILLEILSSATAELKEGVISSVLASIDIKQNEQGLVSLADELDLPFKTYAADALRKVEDQLSIKSDIVFKEVGCYGVAEAAALVAASELTGNPAELVLNKIKNKRATVAIARSYY